MASGKLILHFYKGFNRKSVVFENALKGSCGPLNLLLWPFKTMCKWYKIVFVAYVAQGEDL
jgi:hypothetical protein